MKLFIIVAAFALLFGINVSAQSQEKKGCCSSEKTAAVTTEQKEKSFCDVPENGEVSMTLTSDKKSSSSKEKKSTAKTGSCCSTESKPKNEAK
jgi:hypothetical protein